MAPTPITILTGFLGSGKTTTIIKLIPQLPPTYKLALLKNEFGDLEIDSQLASSESISGVQELVNGCICCNLVGQLGDALETLRSEQNPDRIVIETSGSAFPATLALEVNRIADESNGENFYLDGVVTVIDVENWEGYEDTSPTSRMQAQYTDFVIFNKWENVDERRFDICLDRLGDMDLEIPWVKSDNGKVSKDVILGIDGALMKDMRDPGLLHEHEHEHDHDSQENHQSEVEVLSVTLKLAGNGNDDNGHPAAIDQQKLKEWLSKAPKDEIYRIKAMMYFSSPPEDSEGKKVQASESQSEGPSKYILNWAFGRWTYTSIGHLKEKAETSHGLSTPPHTSDKPDSEPVLRMSVICGRYESNKWQKKLEKGEIVKLENPSQQDHAELSIQRLV